MFDNVEPDTFPNERRAYSHTTAAVVFGTIGSMLLSLWQVGIITERVIDVAIEASVVVNTILFAWNKSRKPSEYFVCMHDGST